MISNLSLIENKEALSIFIELLQVDKFIKQCQCFACGDLTNFHFHLSISNVDDVVEKRLNRGGG